MICIQIADLFHSAVQCDASVLFRLQLPQNWTIKMEMLKLLLTCLAFVHLGLIWEWFQVFMKQWPISELYWIRKQWFTANQSGPKHKLLSSRYRSGNCGNRLLGRNYITKQYKHNELRTLLNQQNQFIMLLINDSKRFENTISYLSFSTLFCCHGIFISDTHL